MSAAQGLTKEKIALSLLYRVLKRVSWEDCKIHEGGIVLPNKFDDDVEHAARQMKSIGEEWEEWT